MNADGNLNLLEFPEKKYFHHGSAQLMSGWACSLLCGEFTEAEKRDGHLCYVKPPVEKPEPLLWIDPDTLSYGDFGGNHDDVYRIIQVHLDMGENLGNVWEWRVHFVHALDTWRLGLHAGHNGFDVGVRPRYNKVVRKYYGPELYGTAFFIHSLRDGHFTMHEELGIPYLRGKCTFYSAN